MLSRFVLQLGYSSKRRFDNLRCGAQALLDMYTIRRELGRLDGFKIALIGDLANGRTTHSLAYLLSKFKDVEMIFCSPENIRMKPDLKQYLTDMEVPWREESNLEAVAAEVDVLYQTRIQKERFLVRRCTARPQHICQFEHERTNLSDAPAMSSNASSMQLSATSIPMECMLVMRQSSCSPGRKRDLGTCRIGQSSTMSAKASSSSTKRCAPS